ncbi:MAG: hypothetical protein GY822_24280, partial [Deltaproteobacteria bacterium]|nr:hypothetical protein [Deltaproteobacteria bacterium]
MFSSEVERVINAAFQDAHQRRHEVATEEHLLFALLADDETAEHLDQSGGDVKAIRDALLRFTSLYFALLRFTSLYFALLRFTSLYFALLRFTSLYF